ncbi:MAG TPA: hypothetical protein VM764_04095 [Gemmatimonadaceae bacterium]|nr:hypothetical protein [Gemmatimonadaceae bacterium]
MRLRITLFAAAFVAAPVLSAQSPSSRDSNRGAPAAVELARLSLPTAKVAKERSNVAAMLVEKRKKLGLDDAAVDSLKRIAADIDARHAPTLGTYDSLRTKVRAAQNTGEDATLEGRARVAMTGTTLQSLGKGRDADVAAVLAVIPADKHAAAKELIAEQEEEFAKLSNTRAGGRRRP